MSVPDPITRQETYLAAAAGESVQLPEPITREEIYLAKMAGETVETPSPITRHEIFLDAAAQGGGGGGVTVEPLSVTENGTYTAQTGKAYSPVVVNVPGITRLTTTFTAAESSGSGEIPLPSNDMPFLVLIETTTQGTNVEDFTNGEVIGCAMAPCALPSIGNIEIHRRTNGGYNFKHKTNWYLQTGSLSQEKNTAYASGNYAIDDGKLKYRLIANAEFSPGVTYNISCYYLTGGNG